MGGKYAAIHRSPQRIAFRIITFANMRIYHLAKAWIALLTVTVFGCNGQVPQPTSSEFSDYWYAGEAELCKYDLQQKRYGELRDGTTVMVFVTEDFNTEQQVKQEREAGEESTTVLKLNAMSNYVTGIYSYSVMTSTFTPVDTKNYPHSLKVTNSIQDWCGQTFLQLNARGGDYEYQMFSYFQARGDKHGDLEQTWLEDEIWNRIRINPQSLPLGNCRVIPGAAYFRLNHAEIQAHKAIATLTLEVTDQTSDKEFLIYTLTYPELERKLSIRFQSEFPYQIVGWEEKGTNGELISNGTLTHSVREPYWKLNAKKHINYRDSLGLDH